MNNPQIEEADDKAAFSVQRLLPLVILLGFVVLVFSMGWHRYLSFEVLADNRDRLKDFVSENFFLAALAYVAVYAAAIALSVPGGLILTVTGGFVFGIWIGPPLAVIAATIGATVIFLVAKTSLGDTLAERAGPAIENFRRGFQENALSYLLFLRLVPLFPFFLVNVAPAFLGVNLRTYVIGTFVGIIPGTFAYAFAGAGLDSVIEKQRELYDACLAKEQSGTLPAGETCSFTIEPSALVTTELIFAFAALGLVALIPVVAKRFSKNNTSN